MITAVIHNRSLTMRHTYAGGIASTALSGLSSGAARVTAGLNTQIAGFQSKIIEFNNQLNGFLSAFNTERDIIAQKVSQGLSLDPLYTGARSDAVKLAWKFEKADIQMGGYGSGDYTPAQRLENARRGIGSYRVTDTSAARRERFAAVR